MKKLFLAASAFALAAACTAGAQTGAPSASAALSAEMAGAPLVECDILTTQTPNGVRFSAVARADAPASGSYEFTLTKSDRNGASDINQAGEFEIMTADSQSLGEAELSLERRSRYRALLVMWDADGEVCRAEQES